MRPDIYSKVAQIEAQTLYRGVQIEPESLVFGYRDAHYFAKKGDLYTTTKFKDALMYATTASQKTSQAIIMEYQFPKDFFAKGYYLPDIVNKDYVFRMTSVYDELPFVHRIGVVDLTQQPEKPITWYTLEEFLIKFQPQNLALLDGKYQAPVNVVEERYSRIPKPKGQVLANPADKVIALRQDGREKEAQALSENTLSILRHDDVDLSKANGFNTKKVILEKSKYEAYFREDFRELAAFEISEILAPGLVPPTTYRSFPTEDALGRPDLREGSLQLAIPGTEGKDPSEYNAIEHFFEFVIAANDNHSGNSVKSPKGNVFYFDFEKALRENKTDEAHLQMLFEHYTDGVPPENLRLSQKDIQRLQKIPDALFRERLSGLLSPKAIEAVIARKKYYLDKMSAVEPQIFSVISHQNKLRRAKGISEAQLSLSIQNRTQNGRTSIWIDLPKAFPDHPIAGEFLVYKDVLIRAVPNDIYSLNYVYSFTGSRVSKIETFGRWFLNQRNDQIISLFRRMNSLEFRLWTEKHYEKLGSDWGHGTKVLHFSTAASFTSSPNPLSDPLIRIDIPKTALLDLDHQGRLWSALLDDTAMIAEFVIPADNLKKLIESKKVRINLK
jgi:hypothetical protein